MSPPLLEARNLTRRFRKPGYGRDSNLALDGVSFRLGHGESLGIVGGSGAGKTTLIKLCLALDRPDAGEALFEGQGVSGLKGQGLRGFRLASQLVFQDPKSSIDPRRSVGYSVAEPLHLTKASKDDRAKAVARGLEEVGMSSSVADRYPHELSGGQRQRVAIARALVTRPKLLFLDEPVSALDVSIQAQVLTLLKKLRRELHVACVLVSHDLAVVAQTCERVLVLDHGRAVEEGPTERVLDAPRHAATRALTDAVLPPDPGLARAKLGRFRSNRR